MRNHTQLRRQDKQVVAEMRAVPGGDESFCRAQTLLEIHRQLARAVSLPPEPAAQKLLLLRRKERGKQFFSGGDQEGRVPHGEFEYSIRMSTVSFLLLFLASIPTKNKV
jgi:hypothetical protein